MPLIWREPELFLEVDDVAIFHTYADEFSNIPQAYWYSTLATAPIGSAYEFDVRELPGYDSMRDGWNHQEHKRVIIAAVSAGLLKSNVAPCRITHD